MGFEAGEVASHMQEIVKTLTVSRTKGKNFDPVSRRGCEKS